MPVKYTRPILVVLPPRPVVNKKPQFGSFAGRFEKFAIKGLRKPFGNIPAPVFITNLRVKSIMRFMFQSDRIIGEISFLATPLFSAMETTYWDKFTKKRNAYRQLLPSGFIHLPKRLGYNITACRTSRRYLRVLSRLVKGAMHVDIDFIGSVGRPALEARFDVDAGGNMAELSSVTPYFLPKRCEASYCFTAPMSGWLSENYAKDLIFSPETSLCFLDYRKAYSSIHTSRILLTGFNRIAGKIVSFQINSSIAQDSYKYNDNVIFYDGEITPLPPVKITMPYGYTKQWIIQDTEGMVDLTFEPISTQDRHLTAFLLKANYSTIYGTFAGNVLRKDGSPVTLEKFTGIAKRLDFRF